MNRSFINLMVESYISDYDLETEKTISAANTIIEYMDDIKENDYELYNYIHSLPKYKQKDFIYGILNESINLWSVSGYGFIIFVIISVIAAYSYLERGPDWYQSVTNTISRISTVTTYTFNRFKERWNRSATAIDLIITPNYHNCIDKCQISSTFSSKNSLMTRALVKMYSEDGFSGVKRVGFLFRNKEFLSPTNLDCLINCSLDSLSTLIAKYAGLYINCVKKSDTIYSDIKISSTLDLGRIPPDVGQCKDLRDNYRELFDNYIYILEILFKGNNRNQNAPQMFDKWMAILERKINSVNNNDYNNLLSISKQYISDDKSDMNPAIKFG